MWCRVRPAYHHVRPASPGRSTARPATRLARPTSFPRWYTRTAPSSWFLRTGRSAAVAATTEIYTLSLHDALPIYRERANRVDAKLIEFGRGFELHFCAHDDEFQVSRLRFQATRRVRFARRYTAGEINRLSLKCFRESLLCNCLECKESPAAQKTMWELISWLDFVFHPFARFIKHRDLHGFPFPHADHCHY